MKRVRTKKKNCINVKICPKISKQGCVLTGFGVVVVVDFGVVVVVELVSCSVEFPTT